MGTRVDFYVGRGESAEWLGSRMAVTFGPRSGLITISLPREEPTR